VERGSLRCLIHLLPLNSDPSSSPIADRANLDSRHFDPDHYVETMLRDKGIKDLLAQDRQMIAAKNRLDTEMQELVYQNYEKFISATDMIRKMKSNVEGMEVRYILSYHMYHLH
jgi:hypothetical protein